MGKKIYNHIKLFIIVIVVYIALIFYVYYKQFGFLYHNELGNYLSGAFAPISALGTIFISYLIYKLTTSDKRADEDFRLIIGIYFKIQETYELLKKQNHPSSFLDDHNSYYERQIKVDCLLLLNYIRRYPKRKYSTKNIEKTIMGIYVNPNYESDYIELADEIQDFCYELNPDWNMSKFEIEKR